MSSTDAGTVALVALRARAQTLHEALDAVIAPTDDDGRPVATATRLRDAAEALAAQLASLEGVLDAERTAPVRERVARLAEVAAPVRDVEAVGEVLADALAAVPRALVLGPVGDRLRQAVRARRDEAAAALEAAVGDPECAATLREVDRLVITPPLGDRAGGKPGKVLGKAAAADDGRLEALLGEGPALGVDPAHDREVRAAALAVAVSSTTAVDEHGKKARKLAEAAAEVVAAAEGVGDADRASRLLVDLADQAHRRREPGFTYGRAHAVVAARRDGALADLDRALADVGDDKRRSWLPGR